MWDGARGGGSGRARRVAWGWPAGGPSGGPRRPREKRRTRSPPVARPARVAGWPRETGGEGGTGGGTTRRGRGPRRGARGAGGRAQSGDPGKRRNFLATLPPGGLGRRRRPCSPRVARPPGRPPEGHPGPPGERESSASAARAKRRRGSRDPRHAVDLDGSGEEAQAHRSDGWDPRGERPQPQTRIRCLPHHL